ncbi:hypothetical protein [Meiothermus taiwanensis]|uniref:hypothetical protein n=1 Tax=Meiothermus taiwanensis TaxID=172827 RepID=UPI001CBE1D2F|nr:hypothetical protein [Meiothermus taiwanensis]
MPPYPWQPIGQLPHIASFLPADFSAALAPALAAQVGQGHQIAGLSPGLAECLGALVGADKTSMHQHNAGEGARAPGFTDFSEQGHIAFEVHSQPDKGFIGKLLDFPVVARARLQ